MSTVTADRRVPWLAYGYASMMALTVGHFLLGIPIQLSDSFGQMLKVTGPWRDLLYGEFTQHAFMRPLDWGAMKLVYELSGGNYFRWFRGTHALEVLIVALLYVGLVRPKTLRDLAVLPLGLAVLIGLHTFQGTVREAFPLNHFIAIVIFCMAAANLVTARYRWWNDLLAVVLFVVSALTLESGLLVGVVFLGGVLLGERGVSRRGAAAVFVLLAGYVILRFQVLGVGSPDLVERSSGFGFGILEPRDIVERFGSNRAAFYFYNIVCSALSVLFSEPTGGVFALTHNVMTGDVSFADVVSPIASLSVTGLIAIFIWHRRHAWLSWQLDRDDRLVMLFLMVLCANAIISFPYLKDVVMSPAGAFLAVAAFVAARDVLGWLPARISPAMTVALVTAFAVIGTAWAIRVTGTYLNLRSAAYVERNDWAYAESTFAADGVTLTDSDRVLFRTLHDDAVFVHPAPPPLRPPLRVLFGD
jgi:hypothetical protein